MRAVAVGRESTFVEFTAVFEHVFGDFAQIEVQVACIVRHLPVDFREGIHHPKLHVLHIGRIEVRRFDATHHATPALCRVAQFTVAVERGVEVVRTAFVGIEGQVEDGKGGRILIVQALVGVEVAGINFSHARVGELLHIVLDVARCERGAAACEERIDHIPCEERTVVAVAHVVGELRLCKHRGRRGDRPLLWGRNVDVCFRIFEIVDIRCIALCTGVASGDELRKFGREIDVRRRRGVHERQAIDQIGQPLTLCLPGHVQPPNCVVQRFAAHGHLRRQGLFAQVHERTAHLELFRYIILEINAEHRFALHAVVGVRFHRARHRRSRVEDALVENLDRSRVVVDGIVRPLSEQLSTGTHHNAPLRNTGGVELNFVCFGRFEFAGNPEFVVFCDLFRHGMGRVVEFGVGKLSSEGRIADGFDQVSAERLHDGEEDAARGGIHGVSFHKVKISVRHSACVVVQSVESHHRKQTLVLHGGDGEIREIDSRGVRKVFHVEHESFSLHVGGAERIHVAHHQGPVALTRCASGVFQALHDERSRVVFQVGREFAHLIVLPLVSVLKCHGQHLVGLQSRAQ